MTTGRDPAAGLSVQQSFTHHGNEVSAQARRQGRTWTVREPLETFLESSHRWSLTTWRTHTGEARMLCRGQLGPARGWTG